jgi:hypothetical protein
VSAYWTVERELQIGGSKLRLVIGNEHYEFSMRLASADVTAPGGREKINAWLMGVVTIPGIGLPIAEAERFLDWLDEHFPVPPSGLRRPKFRLF